MEYHSEGRGNRRGGNRGTHGHRGAHRGRGGHGYRRGRGYRGGSRGFGHYMGHHPMMHHYQHHDHVAHGYRQHHRNGREGQFDHHGMPYMESYEAGAFEYHPEDVRGEGYVHGFGNFPNQDGFGVPNAFDSYAYQGGQFVVRRFDGRSPGYVPSEQADELGFAADAAMQQPMRLFYPKPSPPSRSATGRKENGGGKRAHGKDTRSFRNDNQHQLGGHYNSRGAASVISRSRRSTEESGIVDEDLRTKLTRQLAHESYECLVCCDHVKVQDSVWSCEECFAVFHLRCIKRWAATSQSQEGGADGPGWRCPACSNITRVIPTEYRCFCGKVKNPKIEYSDSAHACGQICKRKGKGTCPHKCVLQCHPGPCPPCPKHVDVLCNCGSKKIKVRCGASENVQCGEVCNKKLACGVHSCVVVCHAGPCGACDEHVEQECHCGKEGRRVDCTADTVAQQRYSCGQTCGQLLSCGHHNCTQQCHLGDCGSCERDPAVVTTCPCGKKQLNQQSRLTCVDPIETCGAVCGKLLFCGPEAEQHKCKQQCHDGPCPPCDGVSPRMCRCGANIVEISCSNLVEYFDRPVTCERRCNKKRSCKLHKCGEICCAATEHPCLQICDRLLSCGNHRCELLCHNGKCPPCLQASFQELYCECGNEVLHPPVSCGAKPPPCNRPCTREHACQHPVHHTCHSEDQCPPCTYLVEKRCVGDHETRRNIPCHLEEISCGLPCGRELPCGHRCTRPCHKHEAKDDKCVSLCSVKRPCGHPCNEPCHDAEPCPQTGCKTQVTLSCPCGVQKRQVTCYEGTTMFEKAKRTRLMASQVEAMESSVMLLKASVSDRYVTLQCLPECEQIERNRRFAEALSLGDVETGTDPAPVYTDFLKQQIAVNPGFVLSVEKTLVDLVTKVSTQSVLKRSHAFPSANRDNRHVIHEYSEYFKIQTVAYDAEPNRNVVATAERGVAEIPKKLLSQAVELVGKRTKPKVLVPASLPSDAWFGTG